MDMEQQSRGHEQQQQMNAVAIYGSSSDGQQIQLNKENLVSFDPNDFQVESPQLPQDQILNNIRNFTLEKQASSAKASARQISTPIASSAQEAQRSLIQGPITSEDVKPEPPVSQQEQEIEDVASGLDEEKQLLDELERLG